MVIFNFLESLHSTLLSFSSFSGQFVIRIRFSYLLHVRIDARVGFSTLQLVSEVGYLLDMPIYLGFRLLAYDDSTLLDVEIKVEKRSRDSTMNVKIRTFNMTKTSYHIKETILRYHKFCENYSRPNILANTFSNVYLILLYESRSKS